MRVAHHQNCKLRSSAYTATDCIIDMLRHYPGGYSFWHLLPQHGVNNRDSLRKKIADTLLSTFFDSSFLTNLIQAAFTIQGRPVQQSQLYHWLLTQVYGNNIQRLYKDWLEVSKLHTSTGVLQ